MSQGPINAELSVSVLPTQFVDDLAKIPAELITVRDWVRWCATQMSSRQCYFGHGTDNAWDEAVHLVLWVINQPFEQLQWIMDCRLSENESKRVFDLLVKRVVDHIPLPYLTGVAWFLGLKFIVNEHTLIPRSPIAELIENNFAPHLSDYPYRILDLCTGSGCIGIVCALHYDQAEVDLADISLEALQVAKKNCANYKLDDRVSIIESDVFSAVDKKYDLIVANPPYVDAQDMSALPLEYHAEPEMALASGLDGLDITRKILSNAAQHLTHKGLLVCEVGNSWEALEESLPDVPFFWPEFASGGHGVFILNKQQCDALFVKE